MSTSSINFTRVMELSQKIKNKTATQGEKDEYMLLLFKNGNIKKDQYDNYLSNRNNEEIIDTALTIGGIVLLAYLLSKILK